MIPKKMAYRAGAGKTLRYVYRGAGHAHQLAGLDHLCSQTISPSPITFKPKSKEIAEIDTDFMEAEMDYVASKNTRSKKLVAHYVISLSEGETLKKSQWRDAIKTYMTAMGYGDDTRWTAVLHDEKDAQHAHIVACRVQNSSALNYTLVSDKGDFKRGMDVMRKLEKKFGLTATPSPRETWGKEIPQDLFETVIKQHEAAETKEEQEAIELPWHQRVIARLSQAVEHSRGMTFTDFLTACEKVGVKPLVRLNEAGFPTGISYAFEGRSESGYRLKSSRLTFTALTGKKYDDRMGEMLKVSDLNEGIIYEQKRDIHACNATARTERAKRSFYNTFAPPVRRHGGFKPSGLSM